MPPSAACPSGAARPRGPGESRGLRRSPQPPAPCPLRTPRSPAPAGRPRLRRSGKGPRSRERAQAPAAAASAPVPAPLRSPPAPVVPQVPSASHPPSLPPTAPGRKWGSGPGSRGHPRSGHPCKALGVPVGAGRGPSPACGRRPACARPPAPATWGARAFLCCPGRPRGSLGGRGAFQPPTTCWAGSARLGLGGSRGAPSTGGPRTPRQPGTGPSRGMWPIGGAPAFAPGHTPAPAPMERRSPGTSSRGPHWLRTVPGGHSRSARTTSCSRGPSSPDSNAVAGSQAPTWPTSRHTARHPVSGGPLRPGAPTPLGADGRSRVKQGRQPPGTALPSSGIPAAPGLGAVPRRRLRSWHPSALLRLPGPGPQAARWPCRAEASPAVPAGGPRLRGWRRGRLCARARRLGVPLAPLRTTTGCSLQCGRAPWPRPGTADRVGTSALALPGPLPLPQAYFLNMIVTSLPIPPGTALCDQGPHQFLMTVQPCALTREYAGAPCARRTGDPPRPKRAEPAQQVVGGWKAPRPPRLPRGRPGQQRKALAPQVAGAGGRAHAGRRPHAGLGPLPAPTGTPSALQGCPLLGCPRLPGPLPHFLPGARSGAGTGGRGGCCPGLGPAAPRARSRDRGPFPLRRRRGRPGGAGERGVRRGQGAAGTVGARVTQGARAAPSASVLRRFPVLAGFCRFDLRRPPPPPSRPRHASR
ncbi:unnamed protein product [Nyctereutes procyonoides]|uniref:(raccoon dog) hypothetical protein n=1 Tax=Nyctereutes procyonoides TaxID=34880 RepID=A0A811YZJ7_NYCPR|nr:unnamed protein product [Nyctereutes procyonoides]